MFGFGIYCWFDLCGECEVVLYDICMLCYVGIDVDLLMVCYDVDL